MAGRWGLNRFLKLRKVLVDLKRVWFRRVWGMDIHPTAQFSLSAKFDLTHPKGVHVGAYSYVAFEARLLCHDMTRGIYLDTRVGENCFIGGRCLIMPGVTIGDGSIVGAGSVVVRSCPPGSVVAGNPAKVVREGIVTNHYGRLVGANLKEQDLASYYR